MNHKVIDYFLELTKIPHCSGEEKQISDYLVKFAKDRELEVIQDEALNVIIYKPASDGFEDKDPVILQGHMDMVCVKLDELEFDFATQPLPVVIDGDTIKTEGTTLGADNGIAVAMAMAILDDETLEHPPIEVLITTDEEVGLLGAASIDGGLFKGKTLINLDSESEGVYLTGCAGGVRNVIELPVTYAEPTKNTAYEIRIHGLTGGHSGIEIDKNRANSNKLLGRVLAQLKDIEIASLHGGEKMNAIAKQSFATVLSDEDILEQVAELGELFKQEYSVSDPDLAISVTSAEKPQRVFDQATASKVIALLNLIPQGVQAMSQHFPGLVETSSNFGVLDMSEDVIKFESAHRSSIESKKQTLKDQFEYLAEVFGGKAVTQGDYPGWAYNPDSRIRELFKATYAEMTGEQAETTAIHAGVECGILQDRIGQLDMISLGPNMAEVHTPFENLSISSSIKTYELLVEVLKRL